MDKANLVETRLKALQGGLNKIPDRELNVLFGTRSGLLGSTKIEENYDNIDTLEQRFRDVREILLEMRRRNTIYMLEDASTEDIEWVTYCGKTFDTKKDATIHEKNCKKCLKLKKEEEF